MFLNLNWFLITSVFLLIVGVAPARAAMGELYSESTYVPQYGILTETQVRLPILQIESASLFIGAALQRQDSTSSDQDALYEKNRVMAVLGGRWTVWKSLTLLAEFRTEERSRGGLYLGDIFEYDIKAVPMFSEFYAESFVLPSFHNDPVIAAWFKQGLRFRLSHHFILDPYLEVYVRRSPDADLGRDTEQARAGLRGIYLLGSWSAQVLIYESFVKDESSHNEALFVIGGSF
ncbi:hypothetical protein [Bdellovibrio bacteriovorus]|uniref:hypothetical protein n=1 Tax=Bdellovibrio bacteriovorus TaxID=959 RepID=UPI0035A99C57